MDYWGGGGGGGAKGMLAPCQIIGGGPLSTPMKCRESPSKDEVFKYQLEVTAMGWRCL